MKVVAPNRVQTVTAEMSRSNQAGVIGCALGDQINPALQFSSEGFNFSAKLREKRPRRLVENRVHRVEAQSVDVKIAYPVAGVFNKETTDCIAVRYSEIERQAPGGSVAIGKIRCEVGKIISFRTEVIVNDVENDGQTLAVARIDEALEATRSAVGILHSEWINTVIAPVSVTGKLPDGHKLYRGDAKIF